MFGLIKNQIKTKIGIVLPASYPASRVTHESVSVTADGVKTNSQLLDELYGLIDTDKLSENSYIARNDQYFRIFKKATTNIRFVSVEGDLNGNSIVSYMMALNASGSKFIYHISGSTRIDASNNIADSLTLYY